MITGRSSPIKKGVDVDREDGDGGRETNRRRRWWKAKKKWTTARNKKGNEKLKNKTNQKEMNIKGRKIFTGI